MFIVQNHRDYLKSNWKTLGLCLIIVPYSQLAGSVSLVAKLTANIDWDSPRSEIGSQRKSHTMSQGHRSEEVVRVNLLFFAKSRELVGTSSLANFPLPTSEGRLSGSAVLGTICERFPELAAIRDSVIIAHNEQYCEDLRKREHF